MTDETAMNRPAQPGRGKLRRSPATLDLTPTSVEEATKDEAGTGSSPAADEPSADSPTGEEASRPGAATEAPVAANEPSPATVQEPLAAPAGESEPPVARAEQPENPPPPTSQSGASVRSLALAALLGGVAGALVTIIVQPMVMPVDNTAARLAVLERGLAARENDVGRGDFDALSGRVNDMTGQIAKLGQDLTATTEKADAAANRIAALESSAGGAPPGVAPEAIQALEQRLGTLEAAVRAIDPQRLEASSNEAAEQSRRVGTLTAQALLAQEILSRVTRSEAFAPALDRLAELGVPEDRLRALRTAATAGVPSLAELRDQFATLADRLTAEESQAPADGDLTNRLLTGIRGLVRIRPIDGETGSTEAGVAAVTRALADGDAAAALAAWRKLPEPARQASADWAAHLERRVTAEAAAQQLADESVAALATAPQANAGGGGRP
jgi:hypothetical protein